MYDLAHVWVDPEYEAGVEETVSDDSLTIQDYRDMVRYFYLAIGKAGVAARGFSEPANTALSILLAELSEEVVRISIEKWVFSNYVAPPT